MKSFHHVSFNADEPRQDVNTPSLYGAHNFLIVDGVKTFGLFFDTPARVIFEIDYKASGEISVLCENGNLNFYVIEEESAHSVVKTFLSMIGRSYIPPLWAFGYGQSRWGYKCERDVEKVVRGYEKADMPLDYVCLDIDYMDRYIDFTVNRKRFPDFSGFVSKMRREGIHLVPIVDAGIKVEPGNAVYEEGVRTNYFCTNESGKNFQAAVWPGMTHLPDFLRPEVREWFGKQYKVYTDCGIDGFWNDMNEPAMFYSEYSKNRPRRERKREDPLYVARRITRFASEDVGLADPHALEIAVAAYQACHFIGMPECSVHLTQAVVYMSLAPKSNALYVAYETAKKDAIKELAEPVPLVIRNAPTRLMKELNYGKGYQYAHDTKEKLTSMQCLPDSLKGKEYYHPTEQGLEAKYKAKLEKIKEWKKSH